jgi:hypothetical protein
MMSAFGVSGQINGRECLALWRDGLWYSPDTLVYHRVETLLAEKVGLPATTTGPVYEPGFATLEQAALTFAAAFDTIDVVEGDEPVFDVDDGEDPPAEDDPSVAY